MSCFKRAIDISQIVVAVSTVGALVVIYLQFEFQAETTNRAWRAELLATIYTDSLPPHVRAEAVRAYVLLQRELEEPIVLPEANFENLWLQGVDFTDAQLTSTAFIGAHVENAIFNKAKLGAADFSGAHASRAKFHDANMTDARLSGADLTGCEFIKADLSSAKLQRLERVDVNPDAEKFSDTDYGSGLMYSAANAQNATFEGAIFNRQTEVCGVDVTGAKLEKAVGVSSKQLDCMKRTK